MNADVTRAVLSAYKVVMDSSWPALHPDMHLAARQWSTASATELEMELARYLRQSVQPPSRVRIFWKLGPRFLFGGANEHFSTDAGVSVNDLIGIDDYDKRLPWMPQAAKYRTDDEAVFQSARPRLNILERQKSASGIIWLQVGKAPIFSSAGEVLGIFGMYEIMNSAEGRKLFAARSRPGSPPA